MFTRSGDAQAGPICHDRPMLAQLSNQMADVVTTAAPSVVQVHGSRRPASGVVYTSDVILTTTRALGQEENLHVRRPDGEVRDAELVGWDPVTSLAVIRTEHLIGPPIVPSSDVTRVGHIALALARSWSNAVTATAGIVSVIGGPLRTSNRGAIKEVIRTTAPMHGGFAGGALVDTSGRLIGITTAAAIRGLGVVIPAQIAFATAASVLQHGRPTRGYLGISGQRVTLAGSPHVSDNGPREALLVVSVGSGTPAAAAGVLLGDLILTFDGQSVESPEDLLALLVGHRVGTRVTLGVSRGGQRTDLTVTVGERPTR